MWHFLVHYFSSLGWRTPFQRGKSRRRLQNPRQTRCSKEAIDLWIVFGAVAIFRFGSGCSCSSKITAGCWSLIFYFCNVFFFRICYFLTPCSGIRYTFSPTGLFNLKREEKRNFFLNRNLFKAWSFNAFYFFIDNSGCILVHVCPCKENLVQSCSDCYFISSR